MDRLARRPTWALDRYYCLVSFALRSLTVRVSPPASHGGRDITSTPHAPCRYPHWSPVMTSILFQSYGAHTPTHGYEYVIHTYVMPVLVKALLKYEDATM